MADNQGPQAPPITQGAQDHLAHPVTVTVDQDQVQEQLRYG